MTWYYIRLIFYPVRLLCYWLRSFMVMLTKPGAKTVIPIIICGFGLLLRTMIDPWFGAPITQLAEPFHGTALFTYRIEAAFAVLFVLLYVFFGLVAWFLSPAVGFFPAPKRPLAPMKPIILKEHTIDTVQVSVSVAKPVKGYFNGKLGRVAKRLPPNVAAILGDQGLRPIETLGPLPSSSPNPVPAALPAGGLELEPSPALRPEPVSMPRNPQRPTQPSSAPHIPHGQPGSPIAPHTRTMPPQPSAPLHPAGTPSPSNPGVPNSVRSRPYPPPAAPPPFPTQGE